MPQEIERHRLRPMQIFEDEQARFRSVEMTQHAVVDLDLPILGREGGGRFEQIGRATAERFDPGSVGRGPGGFRRAAPENFDRSGFGGRAQLANQRSLADSGFAADEGDRAVPVPGALERADEGIELCLSSDHGRHGRFPSR